MGKLNMPKVERYIGATLARGVILIVEDDDLPIATMGLRVQDFWWSDDTALVDAFTYVAPEGRKTSAFRMMFRKAKEMANKAHMPFSWRTSVMWTKKENQSCSDALASQWERQS